MTVLQGKAPGVAAALVEQAGGLLNTAASALVLQHLYTTYVERQPERSWGMMGWRRAMAWKADLRARHNERWAARLAIFMTTDSSEEPAAERA
ncbi:MAG: hypothetical protein ACYDAY_12040 [Candidatus Dormibacteria bacterium]